MVDKGLGRSEGFAWPWGLSERLPEEVDPGAVFPLQALGANLVHRHPRLWMHWCVARTKLMVILILTYLRVLE